MREKARPRVPRPDGMPLPAGAARSISPWNHLALIAVRAGQTTPDTILTLLRVL
ncbi:hypothetical protein JCM10599A_67680 [Paraburkholderia kururiensis]|uniref:hypothetical protein n=1 Tax=Paraburkholderia kururiensis TaxID=984307 RepID=UPI0015923393|nr:hypothetical protein [Paraburkholderia kururiensis]